MEAIRTFSHDLLEQVLYRLTVRQLLQLRCVSRLWFSIIDKGSFIHKHYLIQYAMLKEEGNIPLFCDKSSMRGQDPVQFYLLSKTLENVIVCWTPNLNRDSSTYFMDKPELFDNLYCAGVVNGVVLLHSAYLHLALWNPAIREFKGIPNPRPIQPNVQEHVVGCFAMGFDPKSNDFKIVRSVDWSINKESGWETTRIHELYSLRANSWKSFEFPWPSVVVATSLHVGDGHFNGVHYWRAEERDTSNSSRYRILSFNFSTEVFKLFDPPLPACNDKPIFDWYIGKYMDFLAVIFTDRNFEHNVCIFEVWIVSRFDDDDHEAPLSWQYLFTIETIPSFGYNLHLRSILLDGDMLLVGFGGKDNSRSALYSPTTHALKGLGSMRFLNSLRYVESLFSLSKMQV